MNGNFFIQKGALSVAGQIMDSDFYRDMLPSLKSYDFEVGASCSIAF